MNTYDTFCETKGCKAYFVYRAETFQYALKQLRANGWTAKRRDEHGYESHCPAHAPTPHPTTGGEIVSALIDKVRKLLRLAESPNANEAALAAARAQQLIDEHNLSAALLALDGVETEPEEDIEDFERKGAPLDRQPIKHRWRSYLASTIAEANGCRIYLRGGDIALVGRPSDADTVRYLFAYLASEVERLCEKDGRGCGRTWRNNYRLGVVDTITNKLRAERAKFVTEQREQAAASTNSLALVRVNKALAVVEKRGADVQAWMKQNLKLRAGTSSQSRHNDAARQAGRKAGHSIVVNRARGALGS